MNIQQLIDEKIQKERKEWTPTSWNPSSIGGCLCGAYLRRKGEKPTKRLDERKLRVFEAGKIFEKFVVDLLPTHEEQVRIEDKKLDVTGYADVVIEDEVIEIKSQNSKAFWYYTKRKEPQEHHLMQLWLYMHELKKPKGRLVYVSKDDLAIQEYPLFYNIESEIAKKTLERIAILNEAWKTGVPPKPAEDGTWQAKYCDFHDKCLELHGIKNKVVRI